MPGQSSNADSTADLLLAARQEATSLREVIEAIQDALGAVTARIDRLDAQLGAAVLGQDGAPPAHPGTHAVRTVAEWKLQGWTPATGEEAVTGESLRTRREALGISQAAVAHAAHCSRGLVAEVERSKRRSAQTLAHLASVLDKLEQQARRN